MKMKIPGAESKIRENPASTSILEDIEAAIISPEDPDNRQLLKLACERLKTKSGAKQRDLYSRIEAALAEVGEYK